MSTLSADNFSDRSPHLTERLSGSGTPDYENATHERNAWVEQAAAREAMQLQKFVRTKTTEKGFEVEDYQKINGDSATLGFTASQGEVTEHHDVEIPRHVLSRIPSDAPQFRDLLTEIEYRKQGLNAPAPIRFPCGDRWYTLSCPLAPETLAGLAGSLGLATTATTDQIEKNLHFQFQRLYRKPPEEWTEAEVSQWDRLRSYVDLQAYVAENPTPENRIGVLVNISADQTTVRWNTDGEMTYDTRDVPTTLLAASGGWTVHAIIQRTAAGEQKWLSASVELPLKPNEQVVAEDIASPVAVSLSRLPDADWPKIPPYK